MTYAFHIIVILGLYVMLATSLNLLTGYCGLVSLCHAAFYGVGGYFTALVVDRLGVPFLVGLPLCALASAALSLLISLPSVKLRGDYFVLASFGFQMVTFSILYNWTELTGGPAGLAGIKHPNVAGLVVDSVPQYAALSGVLAVTCVLAAWWFVERSRLGLHMKAVRDNEVTAETLGVSKVVTRITAFAVSAGMAALAGCVFAHYMSFIDPTSFSASESIFILSVVVIGGLGTIRGSVVGAVVMVLLPEVLQFLQIPQAVAPHARQVIYGATLVALMFLRQQGLAGRYRLG